MGERRALARSGGVKCMDSKVIAEVMMKLREGAENVSYPNLNKFWKKR